MRAAALLLAALLAAGAPPLPAGETAPPPPPAPLPAKDPALVDVSLDAGGPRKSLRLAVRGGRVLPSAAGPGREGPDFAASVDVGPDGVLRVDGLPWKGPFLEVEAAAGGRIAVGDRAYPGTLRVAPRKDGTLSVVNRVPFGAYLEGVLAGELFPDAPAEALRALAVLARSFALAHHAELSDDPGRHQAYRGLPAAAVAAVLRKAVEGTAGLRLETRDGKALPNYWYHSTCGGHTAEAAVVFGVPPSEAYGGVPCAHCRPSKFWTWEAEVPEEDLRAALRFGSPVADLTVGGRSMDGRVLTFRAVAAGGTVRFVPALQVRQALGPNRLRSTLVTAVETIGEPGSPPRAVRFRGRGWGHGVGLCQIGACTLAREGWTAERILGFYYPGARIARSAR
jgi:stage II sporulation protein D